MLRSDHYSFSILPTILPTSGREVDSQPAANHNLPMLLLLIVVSASEVCPTERQLVGRWECESGDLSPELRKGGRWSGSVAAGGGSVRVGGTWWSENCQLSLNDGRSETRWQIDEWLPYRMYVKDGSTSITCVAEEGARAIERAIEKGSTKAFAQAVANGAKVATPWIVAQIFIPKLLVPTPRNYALIRAYAERGWIENLKFFEQPVQVFERPPSGGRLQTLAPNLLSFAIAEKDFRLYEVLRPDSERKIELSGEEKPVVEALLLRAKNGEAYGKDVDLSTVSFDALYVLRNAPFARHQRPFKSSSLRVFFYGTGWGDGDPADAEKAMTPTDRENVDLVMREWTRRRG